MMSNPPQTRTVVGFQAVAPSLFATPGGGGWNMDRTMGASIVGGVCGAIAPGGSTVAVRFLFTLVP